MSKKVLLVGHCGSDSTYLRIAVSAAAKGAVIIPVDDATTLRDALEAGADLVLVNRQLDFGFDTDEGVELIRQLRAAHPGLKMMLVSNYPDAQQAAIQAGALAGFGKRELGTPRVKEILLSALQ